MPRQPLQYFGHQVQLSSTSCRQLLATHRQRLQCLPHWLPWWHGNPAVAVSNAALAPVQLHLRWLWLDLISTGMALQMYKSNVMPGMGAAVPALQCTKTVTGTDMTVFQTSCSNRRLALHVRVKRIAGSHASDTRVQLKLPCCANAGSTVCWKPCMCGGNAPHIVSWAGARWRHVEVKPRRHPGWAAYPGSWSPDDTLCSRFSLSGFTIVYLCRCSTTSPVDQETMKKNAWRMPISFLCMQRDLEKDNGRSLVLVLKRSGTVSVKTVHKEYGTILLKGCWWNSQKADVQFSALWAHCPEVDSKAKDMENYRYTMKPIWKRLKLCFA